MLHLNIKTEKEESATNQRQTTLFDYYPSDKAKRSDDSSKYININKLTYQLNNASVLLQRVPDSLLNFYKNKKNDSKRNETSLHDCDAELYTKTPNIFYRDGRMYLKHCLKCKESYNQFGPKSSKCQKCTSNLCFECKKCCRRFAVLRSLVYHRDSQCNPKNFYECNQCLYKTTMYRYMMEHLATNKHTKLNLNFKYNDLLQFSKKQEHLDKNVLFKFESLIRAYTNTSEDKPKECNVKEYTERNADVEDAEKIDFESTELDDSKIYHSYVRIKTRVDSLKMIKRYCSKCDLIIASVRRYTRRCQICDTLLILQCTKCDKSFLKYDYIKSHLRITCYPESYGCIKCYAIFFKEQDIKKHILINHNKVNQTLTEGGEMSERVLDEEMLSEHSDSDYEEPSLLLCEFCPYLTKHQSNFRKHQRIHKR